MARCGWIPMMSPGPTSRTSRGGTGADATSLEAVSATATRARRAERRGGAAFERQRRLRGGAAFRQPLEQELAQSEQQPLSPLRQVDHLVRHVERAEVIGVRPVAAADAHAGVVAFERAARQFV